MKELTKKQLKQQDFIDNSCQRLIESVIEGIDSIAPKVGDKHWDIENISKIREAVQEVIVDKLKLCTEMEFYPYIEEDQATTKHLEIKDDEPAETIEQPAQAQVPKLKKYTVYYLTPRETQENIMAVDESDALRQFGTPSCYDVNEPNEFLAVCEEDADEEPQTKRLDVRIDPIDD